MSMLQDFGGNWTDDKLRVLRKYLEAYNRALAKKPTPHNPFRRVYVDAFAGTGYRPAKRLGGDAAGAQSVFQEFMERDPAEFLKGSAKLALEVKPPFHHYVFVESDAAKVNELENLKREHPEQSVEVIRSDANEFLCRFCNRDWRGTRAVVFLDPFATEVQWTSIEAVAATKAIDVWILFPLMAVNRLLANNPAKMWSARLNEVFGTGDWFSRFYRAQRREDIFGQSVEEVQRRCDTEMIGAFFQERLARVFAGVADNPVVLRNTRGNPLFQLFFAAGNEKGAPIAVKIAQDLLKGVHLGR